MEQTPLKLTPDKITVDAALQPRVGGLDVDHVRALQEVHEAWPPLVVVKVSGKYILLDGFHRLAAAQNIGLESVPVRVEVMPEDGDLHALAFALNAQHGRPLCLADRRAYARRLLSQNPEWADREIGRRCGLSSNTVGAVRIELERTAQIEQHTKRIGANGNVYEVGGNLKRRTLGELPQVGLLHVEDIGLSEGDRTPFEVMGNADDYSAADRMHQRRITKFFVNVSVALEEQDALTGWDTPQDAVEAIRLCPGDERAKLLAKSLSGSLQPIGAVAEMILSQLSDLETTA